MGDAFARIGGNFRGREAPFGAVFWGHLRVDRSGVVPCERCGTDALGPVYVFSVADDHSANVYRCTSCEHLTWRWAKASKPADDGKSQR